MYIQEMRSRLSGASGRATMFMRWDLVSEVVVRGDLESGGANMFVQFDTPLCHTLATKRLASNLLWALMLDDVNNAMYRANLWRNLNQICSDTVIGRQKWGPQRLDMRPHVDGVGSACTCSEGPKRKESTSLNVSKTN